MISLSALFSSVSFSQKNEAFEEVLRYLSELIVDQVFVKDRIREYKHSPQTVTYFALEGLVLENELVAGKKYTKESLRDEISQKFVIDKFDLSQQLIFLTPPLQALLLYQIGLASLAQYFILNLGKDQLSELIRQTLPTWQSTLIEVTDKGFKFAQFKDVALSVDEVIVLFRTLYEGLYKKLVEIVGRKVTEDLFLKSFEKVKENYDYSLIARFLEVFPPGLAEKERVTYLSREEMTKTIIRRTEEINKKALELEESNKYLETNRRAMLNLLEDSKALELKLQIERDRSQAIISSMGEGLLVVDEHLRLTVINPVAEKLLGVTAKEFIGKHWNQIATTIKGSSEVPEEERTFSQALKHQKTIVTSVEDNHSYKTLDGRIFPVVSVTAPLMNTKQVVGAVKVFHDATVEKHQKELVEKLVQERTAELNQKNIALQKAQTEITQGWFALQEEKARLTSSIVSLSLGFILTDISDNIIIMNPASSKILNLQQEIKGFSEIEKILKDSFDLHQLHQQCQLERKSVEAKSVEFGSKFIRIVLAPILSMAKGTEEMIGTVILLEDTTEAKVLERSKDEFFSIASHELRTPLTAIRGNTSMILEYYKEQLKDQDLIDMLTDINLSSVRLIEIVNDFLNVSRLEQGKMMFKKSAFDLVPMVSQVMEELKIVSAQNAVELKVENTSTVIPQIIADPDKTKEILINLIGNAVKFTDHGVVAVSVAVDQEFLKVFVRDTGRGVSQENQSLLFRKFQQAGSSLLTRDTTKGTGLGLYIASLMVNGMGGKIWLEKSELGQGTTFGFTLPIAK